MIRRSLLALCLLCLAGLAYASAVTWSTTHIGSVITLSGGGLTATYSSGTRPAVFSTGGVSSGQYYWELSVADGGGFVADSAGTGMGGTGSATTSLGSAADLTSVGYYMGTGDGQIYWNSTGQGASYTPGVPAGYPVIICYALDATTRLFWIRVTTSGDWNGIPGNNPAVGIETGGFALPAQVVTPFVPGARLSQAGDAVTASFASASWSGTPPAGYGALPAGGNCTLLTMGVGC